MFRKKQNFVSFSSGSVVIQQDKVLPDGNVERQNLDLSSAVLPPAENYELGALLKAGVPLEQVNCKLISRGSFELPEESVEPSNTESKKEK